RRRTEPHRITRLIPGQERLSPIDGSHHFLFWLADAHAADGVTIEIKIDNCLPTFLAQILKRSALNDAEKPLASVLFCSGSPAGCIVSFRNRHPCPYSTFAS